MKLKHKQEIIRTVDAYDLEEFIKETLGLTYECIAVNEWRNDSSYKFHVKEGDITEKEVERYLDTGKDMYGYELQMDDVLSVLTAEGHIEPGTYLIEVCW